MVREEEYCSLCEDFHCEDEKDVYECYGKYLDKHPKNTKKEIWDVVNQEWIKVLTISLLLFVGCEDIGQERLELFLELSTSLEQVEEDTYAFVYPTNSPHSYIRINIRSNPLNRVFFNSPDTFTIKHQGREVITPVVNYSVYVRGDSTTRQFVYIYPPHKGKTLSIYAIAEDRDGNQISDTIFLNID
jgi:hypothetical protein